MSTLVSRLPTQSVNDCLDTITAVLTTTITAETLRGVYGYRALPGKLAAAAHVSCLRQQLMANPFYDFVLHLFVGHDGSADGLETAERLINSLPRLCLEALLAAPRDRWHKIYEAQPTTLPGAPAALPHSRQAVMVLRVQPK